MERKFDLTIAGSRLWLRAEAIDNDLSLDDARLDMGPGNRAQGLRWETSLAVLDPLSDEEFGADVIVRLPARFSPDKRAQRRLKIPFTVSEGGALALGSPAEEMPVDLPLVAGDYSLMFEVCLGRDVFYILSLLPEKAEAATTLKADGWGLQKDQVLLPGMF